MKSKTSLVWHWASSTFHFPSHWYVLSRMLLKICSSGTLLLLSRDLAWLVFFVLVILRLRNNPFFCQSLACANSQLSFFLLLATMYIPPGRLKLEIQIAKSEPWYYKQHLNDVKSMIKCLKENTTKNRYLYKMVGTSLTVHVVYIPF